MEEARQNSVQKSMTSNIECVHKAVPVYFGAVISNMMEIKQYENLAI